MSANPRFFLGRNQQIFGPLSAAEIEALQQNGQLCSYAWIFKEGDSHWNPIDPPPALPSGASRATGGLRLVAPDDVRAENTVTPSSAAAPAPAVTKAALPAETFRVVLFDARNAISGWLAAASDNGCEIRSDQNGSDPLFVVRGAACLSLHDTRTGETIKLRVRVSSVARAPGGGGWIYRARWEAAPALLASSRSNHKGTSAVAA